MCVCVILSPAADPDNSEERKGCSGRVGKMIFSAGVKQLARVAYVCSIDVLVYVCMYLYIYIYVYIYIYIWYL